MTAVFEKILEMSLTAAVVIVVVLAIRLLLRKAPKKYSYALWAVAAFRLVCPVSFRSVFSIFRFANVVERMEITQPIDPIPSAVIHPDPPVTQAPAVTVPPVTATTPPAAVTLPPSANVEVPPVMTEPAVDLAASAMDVAAIVWLAVLAGLLIYGVVSYVRLRRRMDNAVLLEGNVYQSDRVRSPFILGFVRPKIYLPFGLSGEQQSYVLAHERHHIRRLDHIIRPIAFLILAAHWFNPLVWVAYYLMGRDMEMSCDEKVLGGAENIRKAYSITLLSFAANRRFPSPSPLAFGETGVKGRIKNVLNWKKPALWVTVVAIVVVLAVILGCAANPPRSSEGITPEQEGEYRTAYCCYLSPLSSNYPDGYSGGDGYSYTIATDHVMRGDERLEILSGWEKMTENRWNEMHYIFWDTKLGDYQSQRILTLSDNWYLIEMDDELWIAKSETDSRGESYFQSIYRLQKQGETHKPNEEPPSDEYTSYVSVKCVYQYPAMSAVMPDDSGMIYLIGENKAAILDKEGKGEGVYCSDLPPWQELTVEEWNELFWGGFEPDISGYQEPRIRWLSENFALADLDGTLWILLLPELDSGVSDMVFFAYELAPVNEKEPSPTGWYRSVDCVYMSPLSSWAPMNGDSGYFYQVEGDTLTLVHNGSLPTFGDTTGYAYHHAAEGGWEALTEERWREMADDALMFADPWDIVKGYENPMIRMYEGNYFLLDLDGELWVGETGAHPDGTGYIWDLYRLEKMDSAPEITVEWKANFYADLNHDGSTEILDVTYDHVNETYRLTVEESMGMNVLLEWEFHRQELLSGGYYLYSRDGKDYLLWWAPYSQQGVWHLSYEVISFDEKGGHVVLAQGLRQYDASHIGMEHLTADLDDLRSFEREVNSLLANATPLLVSQTADGGDILIGGQGGPMLWASPADEWEKVQSEQAGSRLLAEWQADLTHDGEVDWIRVVATNWSDERVVPRWETYEVRVENQNGSYTYWTGEAHIAHMGQNGIYLYEKDGEQYLMTWLPGGSTGGFAYYYRVFSLTNDGQEQVLTEGRYTYEHMSQESLLEIQPAGIRMFEDEVNSLLANTIVLVTTDSGEPVYSTAEAPVTQLWKSPADDIEQRQEQVRAESGGGLAGAVTEAAKYTFRYRQDDMPNGLFCGESHRMIGTETEGGIITVYAVTTVRYYAVQGNRMVLRQNDSNVITIYQFAEQDSGQYLLLDSWRGQYNDTDPQYEDEVLANLPEGFAQAALRWRYNDNPAMDCDGQAREYLAKLLMEQVNVMVNVSSTTGNYREVIQSLSEQVKRLAVQAGSEIAAIDAIEEIPTGAVGLGSADYIYRVEYTLSDKEQSHFYLCTHEEWPSDNGLVTSWYLLGYLTEEELQSYNTAEMREKYNLYGNQPDDEVIYLAALCETRQNWSVYNDCLCEQAANWE